MLKSAGNVKQCSKFEKVPSAIGAGLGMVERRLCKFGLSLRGNSAHLSDAKLDSIVRDVIQQTFQTLAAKLVTECHAELHVTMSKHQNKMHIMKMTYNAITKLQGFTVGIAKYQN